MNLKLKFLLSIFLGFLVTNCGSKNTHKTSKTNLAGAYIFNTKSSDAATSSKANLILEIRENGEIFRYTKSDTEPFLIGSVDQGQGFSLDNESSLPHFEIDGEKFFGKIHTTLQQSSQDLSLIGIFFKVYRVEDSNGDIVELENAPFTVELLKTAEPGTETFSTLVNKLDE